MKQMFATKEMMHIPDIIGITLYGIIALVLILFVIISLSGNALVLKGKTGVIACMGIGDYCR